MYILYTIRMHAGSWLGGLRQAGVAMASAIVGVQLGAQYPRPMALALQAGGIAAVATAHAAVLLVLAVAGACRHWKAPDPPSPALSKALPAAKHHARALLTARVVALLGCGLLLCWCASYAPPLHRASTPQLFHFATLALLPSFNPSLHNFFISSLLHSSTPPLHHYTIPPRLRSSVKKLLPPWAPPPACRQSPTMVGRLYARAPFPAVAELLPCAW